MFGKSFRYFALSMIAAAALCVPSAAQIPVPVPPLPPGLHVRITTGAPPAVRHEVRAARPGPDYVWVAGYWADDGGHWAWIPGRWERTVEPGAYWIPARYIHTSHGTIYEPGHWSNQQLVVDEDLRRRSEWRHHEREHERELERERHQEYYRYDRDDHDRR